MSIQFFITPYKPTEWETSTSDLKIDLALFKERFLEKWRDTEFKSTPKSGLLWSEPAEGSAGFFGDVQPNLQVVSFGPGNWEIAIDFALWYREFIWSGYRLFLFNSTSLDSLELGSGTTRDVVRDFILGASA